MSEVVTVSADPFEQLVDHGFPLYRFREKTRTLKVLDETQVITRNNDYKPTPYVTKNHTKVHVILKDVPDIGRELTKTLTDIVWQDMCDTRSLEELDPLKGNSLIVTDDSNDTELAIFSAGRSLSHLVVAVLSTDKVTIIDATDLVYPIRQIQLSPFSNTHTKIILIRTTSSIHLVHLNQDRNIIPMYRLFLPEFSEIHRKVDYSMPTHVEPSPFYNDQYLFSTNNGYTALIDATNNEVLFENLDPISEETKYQSRWTSCGFGKTPFTIYTVTPDCIKEFVIRSGITISTPLAIPNERILAFQTTQHSLYCFATVTSIAVMDRLYPERPLVTWLHRMRDGPPTDILIDRLSDDKWRITAFSKHTQRFTMISLHYVNSPTKDCKPMIKILELFNFTLPILKFEEIFNYKSRINSVGCSIRTITQTEEDVTKGNVILSIYRSFEDGSIRENYIQLESVHHHQEVTSRCPTYRDVVSQSESYNILMAVVKVNLLPERGVRSHLPEILDINVNGFRNYLNDIDPGSQSLEDEFKRRIAEKVQDLKSTCTFRDLFEEDEYQKYKLQDLNDFLDQMEVHEEIERARQIDTFGIYYPNQQPTEKEQHEKLKQAHEKEIHLSSVMIRPLKEDTTQFRYLYTSTYEYKSTFTSKLASNLWSINDTRYDQLDFPTYTTNQVLQNEQFPSVNIYNKLPSPEPSLSQPHHHQSVPDIPTTTKKRKNENHDFTTISTQPLPGVFGSRTKKPTTKKPTKKKSKTSGFK